MGLAPAAGGVLVEVLTGADGAVDAGEIEAVRAEQRPRARRVGRDVFRNGRAGGGEERESEDRGAVHAAASAGDASALADALNELVSDPAERERLAAAARRAAAESYGWDAIAERTLALYRRLHDARAGTGTR
jgi:hypothetical protein